MLNKKVMIGILVAASMGSIAAPAVAKSSFDVFVNFAPPASRYEHVPGPRIGFVWTPGYWDWRGNSYVWISGNYVRERPGYYWHAPQWVRNDRGWYSQPGRWDRSQPVYYRHGARDNDRDGIPNYRDRTPNGRYYSDGRYSRDRYDNDRDGVPNYRDRFPNDRDNDGRPDRYDRNPNNPRR